MSVNSGRITGTTVLTVVLCACGDPGVTTGGVVVTDSAGVEVVMSDAPAWAPGDAWRVGGAEVVIGGGEVDLFDVAGAVRRPDGHFVVADGGTSRVLFFDADGTLETAVGGEGDGPGEFRIIQTLGLGEADTVWVYDFSHRRLSVYDANGALSRTLSPEPSLNAAALAGWSGQGFVATQLWGDGDGGALSPGLTRDPVAFVSYDAGGMLEDTIGMFPGREVLLRPEGQRMTMGVAPFARGVSYDVVGDRLVVGDQIAHELRAYQLDGRLSGILRWAGASLDITEAEVDEWKDQQVESAASADRPSVRAYLADAPVPGQRPAYGPILMGEAGDLWVGSYAHPSQLPSRWDVIDSSGAWLGAVPMPVGFRPMQVGEDWILGLSRDEFDVERVELRSLIR
jgi:hypothetical protein